MIIKIKNGNIWRNVTVDAVEIVFEHNVPAYVEMPYVDTDGKVSNIRMSAKQMNAMLKALAFTDDDLTSGKIAAIKVFRNVMNRTTGKMPDLKQAKEYIESLLV